MNTGLELPALILGPEGDVVLQLSIIERYLSLLRDQLQQRASVETEGARLDVDQSSDSAAVPVLRLDQADLSEEMIEFVTTIGTGNPIEAVGAKTLTTTHFIRVTLPGGLSRYIPCGTIA